MHDQALLGGPLILSSTVTISNLLFSHFLLDY